jgi:hypothetical protein
VEPPVPRVDEERSRRRLRGYPGVGPEMWLTADSANRSLRHDSHLIQAILPASPLSAAPRRHP